MPKQAHASDRSGKTLPPATRLKKFYDDCDFTIEQLAERLRLEPDFRKINRGTLSRWMQGTGPQETIAAALQILEKAFHTRDTLRIAAPTAPEALPILLLQPPKEVQELLPSKNSLAQTVGLKLDFGPPVPLLAVQAYRRLNSGNADVAVAAHDLPALHGMAMSPEVVRLCSIARVPTNALFSKEVKTLVELKDLFARFKDIRFGYPDFTVYGKLLTEFCSQRSISPPELRILGIPEEAVRLFPDVVAGIIGPPSYIAKVRQSLGDRAGVYDLPSFVFPPVTFDVFIRRKANPSNVRRFLEAVRLATQTIDELRRDAQFADVAARLIEHMPKAMWKEPLPYAWKVEQLDPEILLELWKREDEGPNKKTKK